MKSLIKRFTPLWLIEYYRSKNRRRNTFQNKDVKDTFTEIYRSNHWNNSESVSGGGSDLAQTKTLVNELGKMLHSLQIKSVLDIPCGDFNWMQHVDLAGISYTGGDIVAELIENNRTKFAGRPNVRFEVLDLLHNALPKNDLVICRDCLVHLSYEGIHSAIRNLKASGSRYLLTTSFPKHSINYDISTGDWRTLNLQKSPFYFPKPESFINENCTERDGEFRDKSMTLWRLDAISLPAAPWR